MARTRAFLATIFADDIVTIIDSFFKRDPYSDIYTTCYGYYEDCVMCHPCYCIRGACQFNDIELLKIAISRYVNCDECYGMIKAAYHNGRPDVIALVESVIGTNWNEALYGACWSGNEKLVKYAIENGANDWDKALYYAYRGGHENIGARLLLRGASHSSGLAGAAKSGYLELVRDIVIGSHRPLTIHDLDIALACACKNRHVAVANFLIEQGAVIGDIINETIIRSDSMELILSAGIDSHELLKVSISLENLSLLDRAISDGATNFSEGLVEACKKNLPSVATRMITLGASDYKRAQQAACKYDNYALAHYMLEKCREAYENGRKDLLGDGYDTDDDK